MIWQRSTCIGKQFASAHDQAERSIQSDWTTADHKTGHMDGPGGSHSSIERSHAEINPAAAMEIRERKMSGTWREVTLTAAGRSSLLHIPSSKTPRALVVELHGSGLDPSRHSAMSRLSKLMCPEDFAVLLPQGAVPFKLRDDIPIGFAWNIPGTPLPGQVNALTGGDNDVAWVQHLVEATIDALSLSSCPLFLTGYSGGARFASELMSKAVLPWTAAALVAGLRPVRNPRHAPPPTIAFHGLLDPINPYGGGVGTRWDIGVEQAALFYADAQGCATGYDETHVRGGRRRSYRKSDRSERLVLYSVEGGGHGWPGCCDPSHCAAFGPAGSDIDASELISGFFLSRSKKVSALSSERERKDMSHDVRH